MAEYTPRPGVTWETEVRRTEAVIPDGAPVPEPNRAARRALARQNRRATPGKGTRGRVGAPQPAQAPTVQPGDRGPSGGRTAGEER